MIRLLTAALLFASLNVMAEECLDFSPAPGEPTKCDLNQLNNNEVADANKVMENFNTLGDAIDALPTPPTNCTTDQIIKWNGAEWVCATGDLAGLVCEEEDTITFRNGTWQCSSATPPEEPCTTTYYRDYDDDGYGDPANSQCLSSPTGLYTSTNANDCYDYNADAKPGQTEFFSDNRGDGSYDYDCDGTEERRYYVAGSCQVVSSGCDYSPGWSNGNVPSCGLTRDWITACEFQFESTGGASCIEIDENFPRIQTCQ